MPENEIENVADALEQGLDDTDTVRPPGSRLDETRRLVKQYASLMTHIVALLAGVGALFKTCDHSVTKNAYNALSDNITKLSDNQERLGRDVANIHGYLEGLGRQPSYNPPSPSPSPSPSPAAQPPTTVHINRPSPAKPAPVASEKSLEAPASAPATLAPATPVPAPVKPPPFSSVESAK
jgi:hypothetical protein